MASEQCDSDFTQNNISFSARLPSTGLAVDHVGPEVANACHTGYRLSGIGGDDGRALGSKRALEEECISS